MCWTCRKAQVKHFLHLARLYFDPFLAYKEWNEAIEDNTRAREELTKTIDEFAERIRLTLIKEDPDVRS